MPSWLYSQDLLSSRLLFFCWLQVKRFILRMTTLCFCQFLSSFNHMMTSFSSGPVSFWPALFSDGLKMLQPPKLGEHKIFITFFFFNQNNQMCKFLSYFILMSKFTIQWIIKHLLISRIFFFFLEKVKYLDGSLYWFVCKILEAEFCKQYACYLIWYMIFSIFQRNCLNPPKACETEAVLGIFLFNC